MGQVRQEHGEADENYLVTRLWMLPKVGHCGYQSHLKFLFVWAKCTTIHNEHCMHCLAQAIPVYCGRRMDEKS